MVVSPAVIPVTSPLLLIIATLGLELDQSHTPPVEKEESVVVEPIHTA